MAATSNISDGLQITNGGEEFLYFDSSSHDPEGPLIFATSSNLGVQEDSERR